MKLHCFPLLITLIFLLVARSSRAESGTAPPQKQGEAKLAGVRAEILSLFEGLDSGDFDLRNKAAKKLAERATQQEYERVLAEEVHRRLIDAGTSLELRRQLESLDARLPQTTPHANRVSDAELEQLIRQLDDDSYGARLAAVKRLDWLLENPTLGYPIYGRLKQRLAQRDLPLDTWRWIDPLCRRARGVWLSTSNPDRDLPFVDDAQIAAWLDQVQAAKESAKDEADRIRDAAIHELEDRLACEDHAANLKTALESRLARKDLNPKAVASLHGLLDLTRSAMTAEYWQGGRLRSIQHLLVGVPSMPPTAIRPSHFSTINDQVAHCVSGSNLLPGDYPVGVAIPHPSPFSAGAFFHLVNLPTPRRRIVYDCLARIEEKQRFVDLSRRTADRWLAAKRGLSSKELLVLWNLEAREVSRFIGSYVLAVDDRRLTDEALAEMVNRPRAKEFAGQPAPETFGEKPTLHSVLCEQLAIRGTKEAFGGLWKAVQGGRILAPAAAGSKRLDWVALLAIAARDPWPGADAWLAGLVERREPLVIGQKQGAELGATAAAVLLASQGKKPEDFGLKSSGELLPELSLQGHCWESSEGPARVLQWWKQASPSATSVHGDPNGT